ncbi:MAG: phage holin family protein [Deltaproteobacteria bacterium]|nr:phage holin family protein [Deltaproteobacteria bacterium]
MSDVRELVKLEVELATDEVRASAGVGDPVRGHRLLGAAVVAVIIALALFAVALVFAFRRHWGRGRRGGGWGFVALAAVAAAIGYGALPKNPMEETRVRVPWTWR